MDADLQTHALGLSWTQREVMRRASHALRDDDGGVWLIDPVDQPEAIEQAVALGEVRGVIQLLDRHDRDCAPLAARLGVPHHRLSEGGIPGSPFEVGHVVWLRPWHELSLWWPGRRALVVPESLGTAPAWALAGPPVGVHPMLRLLPPARRLRAHDPLHLLVGHGEPLHDERLAELIGEALRRSRWDLPRLPLALPRVLRSS